MHFYTSPFFWAFVATHGLQGATLVVTGHRVGRSVPFTAAMLALVTAGRIVLVLPLCPQCVLGDQYAHYRQRVRGRIFPGVPV